MLLLAPSPLSFFLRLYCRSSGPQIATSPDFGWILVGAPLLWNRSPLRHLFRERSKGSSRHSSRYRSKGSLGNLYRVRSRGSSRQRSKYLSRGFVTASKIAPGTLRDRSSSGHRSRDRSKGSSRHRSRGRFHYSRDFVAASAHQLDPDTFWEKLSFWETWKEVRAFIPLALHLDWSPWSTISSSLYEHVFVHCRRRDMCACFKSQLLSLQSRLRSGHLRDTSSGFPVVLRLFKQFSVFEKIAMSDLFRSGIIFAAGTSRTYALKRLILFFLVLDCLESSGYDSNKIFNILDFLLLGIF